jgi:hypothetical protein
MQHPKDPFPFLRAWHLEDSIMGPEELEEDNPDRFKCARNGDHLMCPFQCNLCHFYNIQRRGPGAKVQDEVLLMCIWRASLDAFWSRESSTVLANLRESGRVLSVCARLGVDQLYPERGPFEIGDLFGMMIACQSLLRSLAPGKNTDMIQFETMRKLR